MGDSAPGVAALARATKWGTIAARPSLRRGREISQVRRRLILVRGHERAVTAPKIGFLADHDHALGVATVLWPVRMLVRRAAVGLEHGPGTGEGVVDQRDFVVQESRNGLVEIDALLDDGG